MKPGAGWSSQSSPSVDPGGQPAFEGVIVTARDARTDLLQPGAGPALDAIISLADLRDGVSASPRGGPTVTPGERINVRGFLKDPLMV